MGIAVKSGIEILGYAEPFGRIADRKSGKDI
jgi:hypothetical protein